MGGQYNLRGTETEKRKYELIQSLYDSIIEFSKQSRIEDTFSNIKCLKLAIENDGTAVDEDNQLDHYKSDNPALTADTYF